MIKFKIIKFVIHFKFKIVNLKFFISPSPATSPSVFWIIPWAS
jgi:hypothetical protein